MTALQLILALAAGALWREVFAGLWRDSFGPRKRNFGIKQEDKR